MFNRVTPPTINTADKAAIVIAFLKLAAFLKAILPIYTQATAANKVILRAHNPTLDKFITMMENCGVNL